MNYYINVKSTYLIWSMWEIIWKLKFNLGHLIRNSQLIFPMYWNGVYSWWWKNKNRGGCSEYIRGMNQYEVGMEFDFSPAAELAVSSFSHRSQSECSGQPNYTLSLLGSRPQENALFFCPLTVTQYTQFGDPTDASLFPDRERAFSHIHTDIHKHFSVHLFTIPRCFTAF